jgi:hypothetical protein
MQMLYESSDSSDTGVSRIRQHTFAYVSIRFMSQAIQATQACRAYVSIRQHTSAYVSIRQHTLYESSDSKDTGVPRGCL